MYLSRIEVNPYRRATMQAFSSPQILHATVEGSFPALQNVEERNLWRVDRLNGSYYLLLLSREKPDFTHLVEQFGWAAAGQKWETKEYSGFLGRLKAGQNWQFRLCANPVHSVKQEAAPRGKVYAHVTAEQQKQWLLERAKKNGFSLKNGNFDIVERDVKRFRRANKTITLSTATFEGFLTVEEENLFVSALQNGIGRAKAYGCGLLTLMKPR